MRRNSKFRFQIIIAALFIIFILLIFVSQIVDVPHLFFGRESMPIRWTTLMIEFVISVLAGSILLYLTGRWESGMKDTEEKIEQSRRLLLVILEGSPVAILLIRKDKAVWVSKSIVNILGWPVEKWLKEPSIVFCYPSPEEFERVNREIIYRDIAGKGRIAYEYNYVHKDGHRVPTIVKIQALNKDDLGEGVIFSIIDNSDRKKAEEVIRKLNEGLEQKVKERTNELAEKIHELERFKEATINRELRIKELRDEIDLLKKRLEKKPRK